MQFIQPLWPAFPELFLLLAVCVVLIADLFVSDENRVVTSVEDGGRMKGSGAEVWNRLFHVTTFRDGKIVRFSSHTDKNRALEAAGLSE